ncbi:Uncharacterised protein [Collinsella aerofaciens]|uniref:Transcription termination factor Rho n=2 Tax=Collinsella aerofaciens TaxID=74426 RepID=A0A6N3BDS7_9ACTN
MSDQQHENEITTAQTAPAAPGASDQVVMPALVQASVPEAPKAAPTPAPASAEKVAPADDGEGVAPAAEEDAAPVKPKRMRRASKPAADGEETAKPKRRVTRATRTKHTVADSSAPISDEVAQARALAQISDAQVVRARRRAAEREVAALTEFAAPVVSEAPAATEAPVAGQPTEKPAPRTRRRTAAKAEQVAEQVAPEPTEASVRSAAGEGTSPVEPAAPVEASEVPVVDPALRPHRRGRKPKAFIEAEKAAAAAAAARDAAATAESATAADAAVQDAMTSEAAPADAEPADVRPGRSRRTAAKRTSKAKAAKKGASEDSGETTADASTDAAEPQDAEQPASEKPKRGRKKSVKAKASEQQADVEAQVDSGAEANDAAAANVDTAATDGAAPAEADESARPNRRQHKRNDERNDRRNRQRDRKQRNKERNAAPTEPTLSREELAAMKVAELREKAKEFEIETTGKKKAELVEEIYTTAAKAEGFRDIKGILQIRPDSSGIIHAHGYMKSSDDAFVPAYLIRSARLRTGDVIEGSLRPSRGGDKRAGLAKITTVNGVDPEQARNRPKFGDLTPVYPNEPLRMEHGKDSITGRAIDIVSPIGKGQRGLIVSPPKAGKTTILKKICQSISINNPEVHLICLLVDERPEEVTDMQRSIKGEVVASTFDMPAENHTRVAELVIERAKRIVELGGDVVVVLDSITRLARAYNLAAPASGRILSGGVDSAALYPPKRFLGAARNIENGGSLTILASALIDTGSKMDEVIFEEFKGTGNMELKLDRDLADRRIFPAIDPVASGTRNEDLLVDEQMRPFVFGLRRILAGMNNTERAAASFIKGLKGTNTNQEFLVRSAKKHSDYEQTF